MLHSKALLKMYVKERKILYNQSNNYVINNNNYA